jgi:hypothetical protein
MSQKSHKSGRIMIIGWYTYTHGYHIYMLAKLICSHFFMLLLAKESEQKPKKSL